MGPGGRDDVEPSRASVAAPALASGLVTAFSAGNGGTTAQALTFTLVVDGADTSATCTVPAALSSCRTVAAVPVTSGQQVSVRVNRVAGQVLRSLRWTASLTPTP